jgi:hypothetical protein
MSLHPCAGHCTLGLVTCSGTQQLSLPTCTRIHSGTISMGSPMNVALCSGGRTARNIVVAQIACTPQVATLGTHGGLKHDQQNTLSLKFIRCGVCPSQLLGSTSVQRITPRCCYSDAFLLSSTYQHQHEPQLACQRPLSTRCWPALPPCGYAPPSARGEGGAYPPPKQLPLTRSLQ